MAEEPIRIIIKMNPKLVAKIDDWRFANRIPSRAAAIRALIEKALKRSPSKT